MSHSCPLAVTGHSASPSKTSSEAAFTVRGRPVRAWLTSLGLNLVPCSAPWWAPWAGLYHPPDCIPFGEILSACARERSSSLPCKAKQQVCHACYPSPLSTCSLRCAQNNIVISCLPERTDIFQSFRVDSPVQHLIIYTFKRSRRKPWVWKPCRITLKSKVRPPRP